MVRANRALDYAPAPTGAGGSACWLRATFTILLRCARSFRNDFGLDIEPGQIAIHDRLPDHAESGLGPEVVLVVEAVHHLHHVVGGQAGILDVRHLVAAAVLHLLVGDEAVGLGVIVELRARIGVRDAKPGWSRNPATWQS